MVELKVSNCGGCLVEGSENCKRDFFINLIIDMLTQNKEEVFIEVVKVYETVIERALTSSNYMGDRRYFNLLVGRYIQGEESKEVVSYGHINEFLGVLYDRSKVLIKSGGQETLVGEIDWGYNRVAWQLESYGILTLTQLQEMIDEDGLKNIYGLGDKIKKSIVDTMKKINRENEDVLNKKSELCVVEEDIEEIDLLKEKYKKEYERYEEDLARVVKYRLRGNKKNLYKVELFGRGKDQFIEQMTRVMLLRNKQDVSEKNISFYTPYVERVMSQRYEDEIRITMSYIMSSYKKSSYFEVEDEIVNSWMESYFYNIYKIIHELDLSDPSDLLIKEMEIEDLNAEKLLLGSGIWSLSSLKKAIDNKELNGISGLGLKKKKAIEKALIKIS